MATKIYTKPSNPPLDPYHTPAHDLPQALAQHWRPLRHREALQALESAERLSKPSKAQRGSPSPRKRREALQALESAERLSKPSKALSGACTKPVPGS